MLLNNIGFWVAWLLPILVLVAPYLAARRVWSGENPITVTTENARTPYVAGVAVLAIAIPLVANLTFEVSKATEHPWMVGVLFAAMTYALVALWIGVYLVYTFSLESQGDQVQITPSLAPWMTVQYVAIILFVTASFAGLVLIIFAHSGSTPPSQGSQQLTSSPSPSQGSQRLTSIKPLPVPGSDKSEILKAWGNLTARARRGLHIGQRTQSWFSV